jgi:hypothetical protein
MPQITVTKTARTMKTFFKRELKRISIKHPLPNPPPSRRREQRKAPKLSFGEFFDKKGRQAYGQKKLDCSTFAGGKLSS